MGGKKKKKNRDHIPQSWAPSLAFALWEAGDNRGCVMVACALVEQRIAAILQLYFTRVGGMSLDRIKELLDASGNNPTALFASAWSKATTALLVGAIDANTYEHYNLLRKLRNDFAHHAGPVKLTNAVVDSMASLLTPDELPHLVGLMEQHRLREPLWGEINARYSKARARFMQTSLLLLARLGDIQDKIAPDSYQEVKSWFWAE